MMAELAIGQASAGGLRQAFCDRGAQNVGRPAGYSAASEAPQRLP